MSPRRMILLIVGGVLALGILITLLGSQGKVTINLMVSPEDSTVTVDGSPVKAGQLTLSKGVHTLKAERRYFSAAKSTIDTKNLERDQAIYLILGAKTPEAKQYLADHPNEATIREGAGAAEAEAANQKILADFPIVSQLPHKTLEYKIDYSLSPDYKRISFQITLYPVAVSPGTDLYKQQLLELKASALAYLKNQEIDTKKADITFTPDVSSL